MILRKVRRRRENNVNRQMRWSALECLELRPRSQREEDSAYQLSPALIPNTNAAAWSLASR